MPSITELTNRVRMELADLPQGFTQHLTGTGDTTEWKLNYYPVNADSVTASVNDVDIPGIAVEERTGRIVFPSAPADTAAIVVKGTYYRYFSDSDLAEFISDATAQQTMHRTDSYGRAVTLLNLPTVEIYPLALLATIQALYALATDAAFDIDISAPDGVNIPRSERYRQIMDMIAMLQARYKELSQALGIGIYAVEVFTLRRIAKSTGRYVPMYMGQEIEDRNPPQRVYLPIPTDGGEVAPSATTTHDIITIQGDSFSAALDLGVNLTGYTVSAQVRTYAQSAAIAATFAVTVVSASAGTITIGLTPTQTRNLPLRAVWDCQVASNSDVNDVRTMLQGIVFTSREVTR